MRRILGPKKKKKNWLWTTDQTLSLHHTHDCHFKSKNIINELKSKNIMNELVLVYNFTMTRLIIFVCTIYYPNFVFLDLISFIGLKVLLITTYMRPTCQWKRRYIKRAHMKIFQVIDLLWLMTLLKHVSERALV